MSKKEKVFANGFSFKRRENAPDFVVGSLSVKVDDAIGFLKDHDKSGWVNMNVMLSQKGTHYIELDTWEPEKKTEVPVETEGDGKDLPF
jgi:hypothetical protein